MPKWVVFVIVCRNPCLRTRRRSNEVIGNHREFSQWVNPSVTSQAGKFRTERIHLGKNFMGSLQDKADEKPFVPGTFPMWALANKEEFSGNAFHKVPFPDPESKRMEFQMSTLSSAGGAKSKNPSNIYLFYNAITFLPVCGKTIKSCRSVVTFSHSDLYLRSAKAFDVKRNFWCLRPSAGAWGWTYSAVAVVAGGKEGAFNGSEVGNFADPF